MDVNIKKECDDNEIANSDRCTSFICEFCDSDNEEFSVKDELLIHSMKRHPTVCLGCFESLGSLRALWQHVKSIRHEPPVCRDCCQIFSSHMAKELHDCEEVSNSSKEVTRVKTEVVESKVGRHLGKPSIEKTKKIRYMYKDSDDSFSDKDEEDTDEYDPENDEDVSSEEDKDLETGELENISEDESDDEKERASLVRNYNIQDVTLNCTHCSFIWTGHERNPTLVRLRNHTVSAHPKVCPLCFEAFDDVENLHEHQKSMNHKTIVCRPCGVMYLTNTGYRKHMVARHSKQCKFPCPKCSTRLFTEAQLATHLFLHHREGSKSTKTNLYVPKNVCGLCGYKTGSGYANMMHMFEKHRDPNILPVIQCNVCQLGFGRAYDLCTHIQKCHADDPDFEEVLRQLIEDQTTRFYCEPCGRSYDAGNRFLSHLRAVHPSSLQHQCSICSLRFVDNHDLDFHEIHIHNLRPPHVCTECNRNFKANDELYHHLKKAHNISTPAWYCFAHNIRFSSSVKSFHHYQAKHLPIKPPLEFPCEICGKVLSSKFTHKDHVANMHGTELPFECTICWKKFATDFRLKNHQMLHVKKVSCEVCGKSFTNKHRLARHSIVHTGEKPFQCSICGLRVSQTSALKRHMDKVHPGGIAGNPRSTKSRKCRTLAKEKEKSEGGKNESKNERRQVTLSAQWQKSAGSLERPQKVPARPQPKKGAARRRRQPVSSSSEEDRFSDLFDDGDYVPPTKCPALEGRRRSGRLKS